MLSLLTVYVVMTAVHNQWVRRIVQNIKNSNMHDSEQDIFILLFAFDVNV